MKKIISLIAVVAFTTAVFAQDSKAVKAPATEPTKTTASMKHECYMMKNGSLMHCTGDKTVAQKTDVKLLNGVQISHDGMVKMAEGKSVKLTNGQCVSMTGMVGDCDKMHASMPTEKKKTSEVKAPKVEDAIVH